jgi:type II secretory pathway component PulJ
MTGLRDQPLRHGYTVADLYQLTRAAVLADRTGGVDYTDRWDTAWSAIACALYEAEHWPARHDLIRAGWQAIYTDVRDRRRHAGYRDRDHYAGAHTAPRFVQFWTNPRCDFADDLVDGIAAGQIVAGLPDHQREAVLALAMLDDYRAAADHLGLRYSTLTVRVSDARRRFLRHWHQGETPSRVRGTDRRVGAYRAEVTG